MQVLCFGDSSADIRAGKASGIRTYGVQWLSTYQSTEFEETPDLIFTEVDAFIDLIKTEQ